MTDGEDVRILNLTSGDIKTAAAHDVLKML